MARDPVQQNEEQDPPTSGGETTPNDVSMGRRSYLKAASAGVASLAATAAVSSVSADDHYDRVLNAVDDLGCDPNGDEPIQGRIEDALASSTRIDFPEGQYLIDGRISVHGVDNFGLFGAEGAEFVVGDFYGYIIHVRDSTGFRLDGMDINQEVTNNAGNVNVVADDWEISNVTVYGDEHNVQANGEGGHKFNVHAASSNSTGVIRDVEIRGYNQLDQYRSVCGGIRAGPSHRGTLYVRNTYVEGRGNNGAYCSRTNGPVIFQNCYHRNNNISQFRIGHPESRVENCVAEVDESAYPDWVSTSDTYNTRGMRIESKDIFDHGHAGATIEDCDIVIRNTSDSSGGIQVHKRWGRAEIHNTRIQIDEDGIPAIAANSVSFSDISSDDTALNASGVHVTGEAGGGTTINVGSGRDGSRIVDSCLHQTGSNRDGVSASSNTEVANTTINVTGSTTDGVSTSGISTDGTCTIPNLDGSDDEQSDPIEEEEPVEEEEPEEEETGETPEDARLLSFVTDPEAVYADYEFTADGEIEGTTAPEPSPSDQEVSATGVTITQGDGEWSAEGLSGGGYGDAYYVYGPVTDIWLEQPDVMWVELDGERMEPEAVIEETGGADDGSEDEPEDDESEQLLSFVTDPEAVYADYEFTADGEIEGTTASEPSPSDQEVSATGVTITEGDEEWTAEGLSGGGYGDAYHVYGPITDIWLEQPDVMWVELDGERMEPEAVIEETGGADDGSEDDGSEDETEDGEDTGSEDGEDGTDSGNEEDDATDGEDGDTGGEDTDGGEADDGTDDGEDADDEEETDDDSESGGHCTTSSNGRRFCRFDDWDSFLSLFN